MYIYNVCVYILRYIIITSVSVTYSFAYKVNLSFLYPNNYYSLLVFIVTCTKDSTTNKNRQYIYILEDSINCTVHCSY